MREKFIPIDGVVNARGQVLLARDLSWQGLSPPLILEPTKDGTDIMVRDQSRTLMGVMSGTLEMAIRSQPFLFLGVVQGGSIEIEFNNVFIEWEK